MRHIERGRGVLEATLARRWARSASGALDEHLARGRVHPDSPDGWHRRTPLPRVRGGASVAVLVSLAISLDNADDVRPLLRPHGPAASPEARGARRANLQRDHARLRPTLTIALRHPAITAIIFPRDVRAERLPLQHRAERLLPQQDNGRLAANIVAQQDVSFAAIHEKMMRYAEILEIRSRDRHGHPVHGGGGGRGTTANIGRGFISLKPREERKISADEVITRPAQAGAGAGARSTSRPCRTCGSAAASATRSTSSPCRATTWRS